MYTHGISLLFHCEYGRSARIGRDEVGLWLMIESRNGLLKLTRKGNNNPWSACDVDHTWPMSNIVRLCKWIWLGSRCQWFVLAGRVRRLIGSLCICILSLGRPVGVFGAPLVCFWGRLWSSLGRLWLRWGAFGSRWPSFGAPLAFLGPSSDFDKNWTSLSEQVCASPQPAHRIRPPIKKQKQITNYVPS